MNCIEMKWNEMDVVVDLRKGQRLCDTLNTTNATIKSKWLSFFSSCSLTAFWRDLQFPPLFFSYSSLQSFLLIVYFRQYSFFSLRITDIFIELTFYRRAFEIILKLKKTTTTNTPFAKILLHQTLIRYICEAKNQKKGKTQSKYY